MPMTCNPCDDLVNPSVGKLDRNEQSWYNYIIEQNLEM